MVWPNITSGTEYITYGATWNEASGNMFLANDISFSAHQLNSVGTNPLYNGFNAIFEGNGYKISIQNYDGITNILNEGLIRDLSGGELRNIVIDISGIGIDYGGPYGENGILVTQKKTFNSNTDRGAYGSIYYITVNFTNCYLINPANSALLPKFFAANNNNSNSYDIVISHITLSGSLVVQSVSKSGCGIIGTEMFLRYNNIAEIVNITNNIHLTDGLSLLGENFCKELGTSARVDIDNVINNGDISSNSTNFVAGSILGNNALYEASGGIVRIYAKNNGAINEKEMGGIIGKNFAAYSKKDLNVYIVECENNGHIKQPDSGGIIGPYMNQYGAANIHIVKCKNSGNIEGTNSGGILSTHGNDQATGSILIYNCENSGNIVGSYSGGIVGSNSSYNQTSTGSLIINNCINYGDIDASGTGGIIGSDCASGAYPSELDYYIYTLGNTVLKFDGTTWSNDVSMNTSRSDFDTTYYNGKIYSTGGYNTTDGTLSSVEKFNGITWENSVSLNTARKLHRSETLNGYLYVIGGISGTTLLDSIEQFDGIEWLNKNHDMNSARASFGCTVYNKQICVAGGQRTLEPESNSFEIYNPITFSWVESANTLNYARFNNELIVYKDVLYCICGTNSTNNTTIHKSVEKYVDATGWAITSSTKESHSSGFNVTIYNGLVYLIDGLNNNMETFDGTTWTLYTNSSILYPSSNFSIVTTYPSTSILNCYNRGKINNKLSGGIVPSYTGRYLKENNTLLLENNINDGSFNSQEVGGIAGSYLNYEGSGNILISMCSNKSNIKQEYCGGIVGAYAGYQQNQTGQINIITSYNNGILDASSGSGIVSLGLGYNSSGTIDIKNCTNYGTLMNGINTGITTGLIGVNNTGTITFDGCKNYGDISGVFSSTSLPIGCLIGSVGYSDPSGNKTNGHIKIINCDVSNNIDINSTGLGINDYVDIGGLIGTIIVSPDSTNLIIDICNNNVNFGQIIRRSPYNIGNLISSIQDISSTISEYITTIHINNNTITMDTANISVSNTALVNSGIIGILKSNVNNGATNVILNITNNEITSSCENKNNIRNVFITSIGDDNTNTLKNKTINVIGNIINAGNINDNENHNSSMIYSINNITDSLINVYNNTLIVDSIDQNSDSMISGILSANIYDLSSVNIIIDSNNVSLNNIDFNTNTEIAGLMNINTESDTLSNSNDITLTINNNYIVSNTPSSLINNFNGTIFSTNTTIPEYGSPYLGPTGMLTITENRLSSNFYSEDKEYNSDYYFPSVFRPYIYKLREFLGSNYWFGPDQSPLIILESDLIFTTRQIGSESDDTILRTIFKRAIEGILEQKQFEIYPFYHLKVKAGKM